MDQVGAEAGAVLADVVSRPVTAAEDPVLPELVGADLSATDDPAEAALSEAEIGRLRGDVVRLSRGRRFGGTIARLAVAVREGRTEEVLRLLHSGAEDVSFHASDDLAALHDDVVRSGLAVTEAGTSA